MKVFIPAFPTVPVALFTFPTALVAHEGHGLEATFQSLGHWVYSPIHMTMLVVGGAVLLGVTLIVRAVLGVDPAARSSDTRCAEG